MKRVKAAVMEEPGKIVIKDFPYPRLKKDCIIAKIKLAGVCGTDAHIYQGNDPEVKLPIILGHENLAVIQEIGKDLRRDHEMTGQELTEGDRIVFYPGKSCGKCWYDKWLPTNRFGVLCSSRNDFGLTISCKDYPHLFGGFSEYVFLESHVPIYKVRDSLPDEVAVLTDIFASGSGVLKGMMPFPALNEGFGPTRIVVVQGTGPIGLATGIIAKLSGAYKVILIGGPQHRLDFAKKLGIFSSIINIDEVTNPDERVKLVKSETPEEIGADVVVDCTGVPDAVSEGLDMLRKGGTYIETGSFSNTGYTKINVYRHLCNKDVYLLGHFGSPPQSYLTSLRFLEMAWEERNLPINEMVTHKFSLEQTDEAIKAHILKRGIKIVIEPNA